MQDSGRKSWVNTAIVLGVFAWAAIFTWGLHHMTESGKQWRKAMFAATTPLGIDDSANSEAIRVFASRYARCVFSPPPAVDQECVDEALARMTEARSEWASPERVQAEREVVLSLLDHVNASASEKEGKG